MLPTPSTSHVNFDRIYEPAEDSFLLLDTLSNSTELTFLHSRFSPEDAAVLVVEVGTGSGVVLAFINAQAAHILSTSSVLTLAIDINRHACLATEQTITKTALGNVDRAGTLVAAVQADLSTSLKNGSVDVLVFNPPYVPSEESPVSLYSSLADLDPPRTKHQRLEFDGHLLALSYAGGANGMETTLRLLADLPRLLSNRGVAYILLCSQNRPAEVIQLIKNWGTSWRVIIAADSGKKAGWEKLVVLRIWRVSECQEIITETQQ